MVIENVTLAIVIIDVSTVDSRAREPSGPREKVHPKDVTQVCSADVLSNRIMPKERPMAATTMSVGRNQKLSRRSSHLFASHRFISGIRLQLIGYMLSRFLTPRGVDGARISQHCGRGVSVGREVVTLDDPYATSSLQCEKRGLVHEVDTVFLM